MIPKNYSGLILFTASWASEACQSARQILETALSREPQRPAVLELEESSDTEDAFDLLGIEAVPCLIRMRGGREEGRVIGAETKEIMKLISGFGLNENGNVVGDNKNETSDSVDLKALVSKSRLMLFIKGTPEEPRCGFTSQLIKLLSDHGLHPALHYSTFNILSDERIRAALKEWAQWPTYPQIYWEGELLGGLDILREMFGNGQMDEIVRQLLTDQ